MKILIVGGGNMGSTYARSFLRSHIVSKEEMLILEKNQKKVIALEDKDIGTITSRPEECIPVADLIILAVKPQDSSSLFVAIKDHLDPNQVILSIMAGIDTNRIVEKLKTPKVIRAMPNLPAQIGMGMTVFTSTSEVTRIELVMVQNLLNTTGKTIYVEDEDMLNAATAISGSGPAYVFYFMKMLIDNAREMGFTGPQAELLTWQTFRGAVELYHKNNHTCDDWIAMVSSKGGTTEAAIEVFQEKKVPQAVKKGVFGALQRARDLGK